jgi:hypothetical protein
MVDWRLNALLAHPAVKLHWRKVMVYDERDRPWRSFPGLYVSAPARSFDSRQQRASGYLQLPAINAAVGDTPDLLFSFVGSNSASCRELIFRLRHPSSIVEQVHDFMFWDSSSPGFGERRRRYSDVLNRSRFVLCPRGRGTSSFRLYETLAHGRVPVIISNEWVAPIGPNWDAFSIRVSENDARLVQILEAQDENWPRMSAAATAAYNEYFSEDVRFHRMVESLRDVLSTQPSRVAPWAVRTRGLYFASREALSGGQA